MEKVIQNRTLESSNNLSNEDCMIISKQEYKEMQESIKNMNNEIIEHIIEKEIIKEMPKDFDDVYVVAKSIINEKRNKKEKLNIYDIKKIIKDIKLNYPNLFIDIGEYFKEMNMLDLND